MEAAEKDGASKVESRPSQINAAGTKSDNTNEEKSPSSSNDVGAERNHPGEGEPPLSQIDPKCFIDALKAFFHPIKKDDPRLDFYMVYNREAIEYDTKYAGKYTDDLNTTLIFAGLFSAVNSAFVVDIYSKLQPDPQSTVLLRAILLTLNQTAIPNEAAVFSTAQGPSQGTIVVTTALLYASLLISLSTAFVAMLGKQWLNRYLQHTGGSMIARCRDRQSKLDGFQRWQFVFVVESLPVMLQIALLLFAAALCQYTAAINNIVFCVIISFLVPGFAFYVWIVVVGTYSYECPFQTPLSVLFRHTWKEIKPRLTPHTSPIAATLHTWGAFFSATLRTWGAFSASTLRTRGAFIADTLRTRGAFITTTLDTWKGTLQDCVSRIHPLFDIFRSPPDPPLPIAREEPLPPNTRSVIPWFEPGDLDKVLERSTGDTRCVSWVLERITDQEAIDTAVKLAGTVRWFEHKTGTEPPYDQILSTFHACFGSNGEVYPEFRDRAYYSARALLWINSLAECELGDITREFAPLPGKYTAPADDHDLAHLLAVNRTASVRDRFVHLLQVHKEHSPSHSQWISDALLHLSFTKRQTLDFRWIHDPRSFMHSASIPPGAMLNGLLMCCSFLGSPVEKDALRIQDKFDHLEHVLDHVDKAIVPALAPTHPTHKIVRHMLSSLTKLPSRPKCLTEMAYRWCTVLLDRSCEDWKCLLFLSLELGSRHLDPDQGRLQTPSHVDIGERLLDTVFECKESKAIEDLLCAFVVHPLTGALTGVYANHITNLRDSITSPFSPRLRRSVIRSIELIGYKKFEDAGAEKFIKLLNYLNVGVKDIDSKAAWASVFLGAIRSAEGIQLLAIQSWELLVELATDWTRISEDEELEYAPSITKHLLEAGEWDKLECWVALVWMTWPPEIEDAAEDRVAMEWLFRQRPSAVQELPALMERWGQKWRKVVPVSFREIYRQAEGATRADAP